MIERSGTARRFAFEEGSGSGGEALPSHDERMARLRARAGGAPRDAGAQAALGLALLEAGQAAEGRTCLARAVKLDPNQTLARRRLEAACSGAELEDMHLPPPVKPMGGDLLGVLLFPWRTGARFVIIGSCLLFAVVYVVSIFALVFGAIIRIVGLGIVLGVSFGYAVHVCRYAGTGRLDAPGAQDVTDFFEAVRDLARAFALTFVLMLPCIGAACFVEMPAQTLTHVVYANILAALFVWPMGFLVMSLIPVGFDFLKPTVLLPAIARTFWPYGKIVLLTLGLLWAMDAGLGVFWTHVAAALAPLGLLGSLAAACAAWAVHFYVLLVFAHAMGRFYRENERRLGWFTREALRGA